LNVKGVSFTGGKGEIEVKIDTKITPQLKKEGEDRDMIRQIQELRKETGRQLNEWVSLSTPSFPHNEKFVKSATLVKDFRKGKVLKIIRR
jgi:hypothetical protein